MKPGYFCKSLYNNNIMQRFPAILNTTTNKLLTFIIHSVGLHDEINSIIAIVELCSLSELLSYGLGWAIRNQGLWMERSLPSEITSWLTLGGRSSHLWVKPVGPSEIKGLWMGRSLPSLKSLLGNSVGSPLTEARAFKNSLQHTESGGTARIEHCVSASKFL